MEKVWYKDLAGFITANNYYNFFPSASMTFVEQMNALLRMAIYFSIVMFLVRQNSNVFFIPLFMACLTYLLVTVDERHKHQDKEVLNRLGLKEDFRSKEVCQKPSKNNPFMNVLMSDYSVNPQRPKACKIEGRVKQDIKKNFDHNLYRDIDDIFHKKASDRQFYTTPSTTIPNDSIGYANWLYGSLNETCKEGNGNKCYSNMYRAIN